ncbi:Crp/Fnr family transcriptional regulator [Salinibacillus xinjiangensis]|uniref:Helix-turn-helix domain-containing protein n=1 Tax=Salinibacillus xinjiangensis TaxID=1229268 RepID=A0A6G1X9X6_9BACI|nr:Crp/Fnr family transcriptional regulator [Salinibacillus xinjiangensis]MRG87588.1 helix-turn-helix domain-containing protein [Salinibacillus xinjiangensis]
MKSEQSLDKMWYLSKIGFFEFLPMDDLKIFSSYIDHQEIRKSNLIQTPETTKNGLFFVKEGAVRIYGINKDGRMFTHSLLGPYSTYGTLRSFSLGTENVYIETISDVHLCSVSEADFHVLLKEYPSLIYKAMELLSDRLREREKMLEIIATGSVREQMMHLLFSMADTYGKKGQSFVDIPFPLSHQEIANMLGVTREAVSANMRYLKDRGYICSAGRKTIKVNQQAIPSLTN